ncbi:cysteine-rich motor neuron 1 protein isoform X1 [Octopus sinensis]|uniref:Cysteine-rich motor neuron 1 protein isoform X1 n=1 Tax=Octopus sinensis TaxID=2607531 RepID=A0A6P7SHQ2_9MOLL|nr:cysteine-rich motor neuron 1 protein isoform X1 [Octopus sinensis]
MSRRRMSTFSTLIYTTFIFLIFALLSTTTSSELINATTSPTLSAGGDNRLLVLPSSPDGSQPAISETDANRSDSNPTFLAAKLPDKATVSNYTAPSVYLREQVNVTERRWLVPQRQNDSYFKASGREGDKGRDTGVGRRHLRRQPQNYVQYQRKTIIKKHVPAESEPNDFFHPISSRTDLSNETFETSTDSNVASNSTAGPYVAIFNSSSSQAPWLLLPLPSPSSVGTSCPPCDPTRCPHEGGTFLQCPTELRIKDDCGCCVVCLRGLHQTCGGMYQIMGKCRVGLVCLPTKNSDFSALRLSPGNTENPRPSFEGTCELIDDIPDPCRNVGCDTTIKYQCPRDSLLVANVSGATGSASMEICCKERLTCQCNMDACNIPKCIVGYLPQRVHHGTRKPGDCCDNFVCKRNKNCALVKCPKPKSCPKDSVNMVKKLSKDGCCSAESVCQCQHRDRCPAVECSQNFRIEVVEKATHQPGSCCDKFKCVNKNSCFSRGQSYQHGDVWKLDNCTKCSCKNGLTYCQRQTCRSLQCKWVTIPVGECCPVCNGNICFSDGRIYQHLAEWKHDNCTKCSCNNGLISCQKEKCKPLQCGWMTVPQGQCCPVCKGCMNGDRLYKNSETWKEEGCLSCRCNNGVVECQTEMCSVRCPNARSVPGQCCPVCENNCSISCKYGYEVDEKNRQTCKCAAAPSKCPAITSCKRRCKFGYKRTRNGCLRCKCHTCPYIHCNKRCPFGFITNRRGCKLCMCVDEPYNRKSSTPQIPTSSSLWLPSSCMSNGIHYKDGDMWYDGCRECYCREGQELCSLITCNIPKCHNPIFRPGDCCPSCAGTDTLPSKGSTQQRTCHGNNGNDYVEGEVWQLGKCTSCICHYGIILCTTEKCPPQLCHYPIQQSDQCCPLCPNQYPDKPTVSKPHLKYCRGETSFKHGEVWRVSPCQSCMCRNGRINCFSQNCPPMKCQQASFRKGQCCAVCMDNETKTAKSIISKDIPIILTTVGPPEVVKEKVNKKPTSYVAGVSADETSNNNNIIIITVVVPLTAIIIGSMICVFLLKKHCRKPK